jgi:hypothetical protein
MNAAFRFLNRLNIGGSVKMRPETDRSLPMTQLQFIQRQKTVGRAAAAPAIFFAQDSTGVIQPLLYDQFHDGAG